MGKFSLHVAHFKKNQLRCLEMHHLRKGKTHSNKEIKPELSKENILLVRPEKSLYRDVKVDIENKVVGRITKASVWISEMVMTLPKDIPREQAKAYFEDCMKYISTEFNPQHIKLAVVHMDETQPHLHCLIEPITEDNRLSRKAIFTRDFLRNLHQKFPDYLQSKGWNVEHGNDTELGDYRKSIKELKEETRKLEKLNTALKAENRNMIEANYVKICKLYQRYNKLNREISR